MSSISKIQRNILERVADYEPHGSPIRCGTPWAPIRRLLRRQLIEFYVPRRAANGWRYLRLTPGGRLALTGGMEKGAT